VKSAQKKKAKVLLIEDDPTIHRVIRDNLQMESYTVKSAYDGASGLELCAEFDPDLVLLDVMLPGMNGFAVCRSLRQSDVTVPIVMLTAKGEESDVVRGLDLGANDYVVKPFRLQELLARIRVHLKKRGDALRCINLDDFVWDQTAACLNRGGVEIKLTPKERKLLSFFCEHPNQIYTRTQLLDQVWGRSVIVTERSVDRCVASLRKKLSVNSRPQKFLVTLRDVGYRFDL